MRTHLRLLAGLLATVFFLAVNPLAHADDTSSGCGLGWAVTKRQSLISSTTRMYINFTFSSTSAMTSGTSGCAKHSIVENQKKGEHFAEANYHELMVEMASGQGEHLASFANALGCGAGAEAAFGQMTQKNYETIYPSDEVGPTQMLNSVREGIQADPLLSLVCT